MIYYKNHLCLFILLFTISLTGYGQGTNYGALAIDKSNGFYYGWAYDYKTQSDADKKALKECADKGGNCTVVQRFSGEVCAYYRRIPGKVGTAYGWGVAKSKNEADRIANSECLKRSKGQPCTEYVWGCNSKSPKKDDFWDGEKDKKEPKKNNTDDFWDGGKDKKQLLSKNTDFWDGKGSSEEEKKLNENTKPDESDQFIGNVRSRTSRVRIFCVDTGQEDGDLVRISNNGIILKDNIYLRNAGESYWFDLQQGQNKLEIFAINQGSVGSNTAAFKVYDDKGNLLAEKNWNLKTGYKGKLLILKL